MPGIPIPDDWDGETYSCWCIEWPASEQWRAILLGYMSSPKLGREWDETTGSILDVQAIGLEIWEKNRDLEACVVGCSDDFLAILNQIAVSISVSANATASCGCVGGTKTPTTAGEETQPPPFGFQEPPSAVGTPEYDLRKCKLANLTHDNVRQWFQEIDDAGVDDILSGAGRAAIPTITTLIGAILGELSTPFPIVDALAGAVIGFLAGVALAILEEGVELADIVTVLDDHRDDFVCAIYNSTEAGQARLDYLQVAIDNGLSVANQGVLGAALIVDYLNATYFSPGAIEASLEQFLDGYTPTSDCSGCQPSTLWTIPAGTGTVRYDGIPFRVEAEPNGTGGFDAVIEADVGQCPVDDCAGINDFFGVTSDGFGVWSWNPPCPGETRDVNQPTPVIDVWNCMRIAITSSTDFWVDFYITPGNCP